jgi:uncharacterized protein (TIGR01777 family)
MKVLMAGATGFVGRALVLRLRAAGHHVIAYVRSAERAASQLGAEAELLPVDASPQRAAQALEGLDAVINLAGQNLFSGRWSRRRKRDLAESRVETTRRLVDLIGALPGPPRVLISASGVGVYGDRGDEPLDERSSAGEDFLARLCLAWEGAASQAEDHGVRVVALRIGTVLGPEGGALMKLAPAFRWGLGARLGSGRQQVAWIHLRDLLELIVTALSDERYQGPINATAPAGTTNADFTRALAHVFARRAFLSIPSWALRLLIGQAAVVLLASQRVAPRQLERLGFRHRFTELGAALADIFDARRAPVMAPPQRHEAAGLPSEPGHLLRQTTLLDAPLDQVFDFFSRAQNLALMTPSWMDFQIVSDAPASPRAGDFVDYKIRVGPLPMRWRTRFLAWEHGTRFIDNQERGPYRLWHHEHRFSAEGDRTRMEDVVHYTLPLGPLGRLVHRLFVAGQLRRIFSFRAATIALRFTAGSGAAGLGVTPAVLPPDKLASVG